MAFTVRFYQFSKPENSTAVPPAGVASVEFAACQAKTPLSVLSPEISIMFNSQNNGGAEWNPSAYNYCYIAAFNRYYFVRNWTNSGPVWNAALAVDVLASYRTQIGSASVYVLRSSYEFDGTIPDNLYPITTDALNREISLPKLWTLNGANVNNDTSYYYLATITGIAGTRTYAITPSNFTQLINYVMSDDYYDKILGEFGATEYPEAKVALNPLQYLVSLYIVYASIGDTYGMGQATQMLGGIEWGPVYLSTSIPELSGFEYYFFSSIRNNPVGTKYTVDTSAIRHPQSAARGNWLNSQPYTDMMVFLPPFGFIPLDAHEVYERNRLIFDLLLDPVACTVLLRIYVKDASDAGEGVCIHESTASFGVEHAMSNTMYMGVSPVRMAASALSAMSNIVSGAGSGSAAAALGSASGVLNSVESGIGAYVQGITPHTSNMGIFGTICNLVGTPKLFINHWYVTDDNNSAMGRPLMAVKTISNIPGFITAEPSGFSCTGATKTELDEIKSYMKKGFFYV